MVDIPFIVPLSKAASAHKNPASAEPTYDSFSAQGHHKRDTQYTAPNNGTIKEMRVNRAIPANCWESGKPKQLRERFEEPTFETGIFQKQSGVVTTGPRSEVR
jgi:hypothetical protein